MKALHQSQYFSSYQCDNARSFFIDFGHKMVKLSFCQFLSLRQKLKNVDLESHFNGENKYGMEIIVLCNREHLFIFSTLEILDLKDLLHGTFAMLELNSLITTSVKSF